MVSVPDVEVVVGSNPQVRKPAWVVIRLDAQGRPPSKFHADFGLALAEAERLLCETKATFMVARVEQIIAPRTVIDRTVFRDE